MTFSEALRSALDSLRGHKLRSALTMLGMVFGVGAVIAMLAIGAGAERQALAMIESLGLRNVLVRAADLEREDLQEVRQKSPGVAPRDIAAIVEAVPGVDLAAPRVTLDPYAVFSADGRSEAKVYGVSHVQAALSGLEVAEGRFLDAMDERTHAQVAVIGERVRRDLFGFEPAVGRRLKVNQVWLEVVGVLAPGGAAAGDRQEQ
ncbi:MAG TPA: ABC transporter permease, partial [Thermoanaerobaculia bacterium]|nr:ABC transporter permease [Thermoanaerobaculia bacterium]